MRQACQLMLPGAHHEDGDQNDRDRKGPMDAKVGAHFQKRDGNRENGGQIKPSPH